MTTTLRTKTKFHFKDGSNKKPLKEDTLLFCSWKRCNTIVLSWVNHSILT